MNTNKLGLLFTGLITIGFLVAGILDILDYIIVKALLFLAFTLLVVYLIIQVLKEAENKNHLD